MASKRETDLQDILKSFPLPDPTPAEEMVVILRDIATELRLLRETVQEATGQWTINSCS